MTKAVYALVAVAALAVTAACDLPFGVGTPTTRSLESGVEASLNSSSGFEITGFYTQVQQAPPAPFVSGARITPPQSGSRWSIDLQLSRPSGSQHMLLSTTGVKLEAIVMPSLAFFRGQAFLAQFLGGDPQSSQLAKAAGNAWWTGPNTLVPRLPDLTGGTAFRAAFLGSAVRSRADHLSVDGVDAVLLSGPRADVYIASSPPNQLLRVVIHPRVTVDGIGESDLHYINYGKAFSITYPTDVIDFSNLSTLPPIYTVVSVDTTHCTSPCVVSALLKNLGGPTGASAPSTVTFTLTDSATGAVAGSCQAIVTPDVGYNATTSVSCTIALSGAPPNAATVTATPSNPGRG